MTDQTIIYLCGLYCLGFMLFHLGFRRWFHWDTELPKLSDVNRGIMQVMNMRLVFFFGFSAVMCFVYADDLAMTELGNFYLIGMSLFWLGRTIEQFVYFKGDHPLSQLLRYIFLIGAVMFAVPVLL